MNIVVDSVTDMQAFGAKLGRSLKGGEVLELVGDIGAGKTTFTKGLAVGLGVVDDVQSPTFTISRVYEARDGLELSHYDFYRLTEPGVLSMEVYEAVHDPNMITVVEWGGIIEGVLPVDRLTLKITAKTEDSRHIELSAGGEVSSQVMEAIV